MRTNTLDTFKDLINLRKLNNIRRYSLEHIMRDHTVSAHSYWVTLIALQIYEEVREHFAVRGQAISREQVLLKALFHDLSESVVDDIDFHVKRELLDVDKENKYVKEYFSDGIFGKYTKHILNGSSEEEKSIEYRIMKLADITEHFLYCYEEVALRGNRGLREPIESVIDIYEKTPEDAEIFHHSKLLRTVHAELLTLLDNTDWAL